MIESTISNLFPLAMAGIFVNAAVARDMSPLHRVMATVITVWAGFSLLHNIGWV